MRGSWSAPGPPVKAPAVLTLPWSVLTSVQLGSRSHTIRKLCVEGGREAGMLWVSSLAGKGEQDTTSQNHSLCPWESDQWKRLRPGWPAEGASVGVSVQRGPACCHSPVFQSLRYKGKEGIRGEHGPPGVGGTAEQATGKPLAGFP